MKRQAEKNGFLFWKQKHIIFYVGPIEWDLYNAVMWCDPNILNTNESCDDDADDDDAAAAESKTLRWCCVSTHAPMVNFVKLVLLFDPSVYVHAITKLTNNTATTVVMVMKKQKNKQTLATKASYDAAALCWCWRWRLTYGARTLIATPPHGHDHFILFCFARRFWCLPALLCTAAWAVAVSRAFLWTRSIAHIVITVSLMEFFSFRSLWLTQSLVVYHTQPRFYWSRQPARQKYFRLLGLCLPYSSVFFVVLFLWKFFTLCCVPFFCAAPCRLDLAAQVSINAGLVHCLCLLCYQHHWQATMLRHGTTIAPTAGLPACTLWRRWCSGDGRKVKAVDDPCSATRLKIFCAVAGGVYNVLFVTRSAPATMECILKLIILRCPSHTS